MHAVSPLRSFRHGWVHVWRPPLVRAAAGLVDVLCFVLPLLVTVSVGHVPATCPAERPAALLATVPHAGGR